MTRTTCPVTPSRSRGRTGIALVACAALLVAGCGGDGGGGSASAGATQSATVEGQVFDGPVSGATITLFADAGLSSQLTSMTTSSGGDGTFRLTLPPGLLHALATIFVRSTGGIDVDTGAPAPSLEGAASTTGSIVIVTVSPFGAAVNHLLRADAAADIELARQQIAALFGLEVEELDINVRNVGQATRLAAVSRILVRAAERSRPGGGENLDTKVRLFLSALASQIATGGVDLTVLEDAETDVRTGGRGHGSIHIRPPTAFRLSSLAVGDASFDVSAAAVARTTGHPPTVSLTASAAVAGTTLPDVSLELTGRTGHPSGSRFRGGVILNLSGTGSDTRRLSIEAKPVKITAPRGEVSGRVQFLGGTALTVTGVDGNGALSQTVRIDGADLSSSASFTGEATTSGTRLTFHPAEIAAAVRSQLGAQAQGHPIELLEAMGTFDLSLSFQGFPLVNSNGRVAVLRLDGIVRQ